MALRYGPPKNAPSIQLLKICHFEGMFGYVGSTSTVNR